MRDQGCPRHTCPAPWIGRCALTQMARLQFLSPTLHCFMPK